MKKKLLLLLLSLQFCFPIVLISKDVPHNTINALHKYPEEIANIIFEASESLPNHTQISIAIIKNGKTSYYGIIKTNDTIKPAKNETKLFEIGSITKVLTSTVLASLVLDNKLKLNDYINPYYSFPFKDNTIISFESLANHTSGLPRLPDNLDLSYDHNPYKEYGKVEIDNYLKNIISLKSEPNETYLYSNLGAGLLGHTLGVSQKVSFERLLQKRVFKKYKMNNSFTSSKELSNKLVYGLDSNGNVVSNWDFDVLQGAGGVLSTTEDLSKFIIAQFNPKNTDLSLTRKATFQVNQNMSIGLGWHILKSHKGKELVWHNGGTGGYSSSIVVDTDTEVGVVILSNVSAFNPDMENIDKLCFKLLNEIDGNN